MMNLPQNTPLCKVYFDRSARQYIVRNGREIARFPQGPENKVKAQWLAIEHDSADVYAIARELLAGGVDEGRLIRAARLVIEGKITNSEFDGDYVRARVEASDGNRSPVTGWPYYQVTHNLTWTCDCYDYINRADAFDRRPCKHILATQIAQRLAAADAPKCTAQTTQPQPVSEPTSATALPVSASDNGRIEDMLGYDEPKPASAKTVAEQIAEVRAANWWSKPDPINRSRAGAGRAQFRARY